MSADFVTPDEHGFQFGNALDVCGDGFSRMLKNPASVAGFLGFWPFFDRLGWLLSSQPRSSSAFDPLRWL
jgi:hypothetical protein